LLAGVLTSKPEMDYALHRASCIGVCRNSLRKGIAISGSGRRRDLRAGEKIRDLIRSPRWDIT
jgi:hypothetical protein